MEAYAAVLTYAIPGFVLLILIEYILSRWMNLSVNRSMDTISSLSSGMTNTLKDLLGLSVVIVSYNWMETNIGIFNIQSTLWLYIIAFVLIDFASYWSHRFNHEYNLLWNRHIVHHSSEEFNLSCALRQSISGIVGVYFFLYIPMAILGIPAQVVAITAPLHLFAQFWYHTRLIGKMGILEKIIVTPSHHRVHHAINAEYIDKNYAAIFIVWDKLFGTFQEELKDITPVYGVKRQVKTWNPFIINYQHFWLLIKDFWRTNSLWDKVRLWFMPTGWRPSDVLTKFPVSSVENVYEMEKYESNTPEILKGWSWFQLIIHNLLIYYMLVNITEISVNGIFWYSIFIGVSIFAYTSLMDRHIVSLPFELIKLFIGAGILYQYGSWFNLDSVFPFANSLFILYMIISLGLSFYYTLYSKSYDLASESKKTQSDNVLVG